MAEVFKMFGHIILENRAFTVKNIPPLYPGICFIRSKIVAFFVPSSRRPTPEVGRLYIGGGSLKGLGGRVF